MAQRTLCTAIHTNKLTNGLGYQATNGWVQVGDAYIYPELPELTEEQNHIRAAHLFRDWLALYAPFGPKEAWKMPLMTGRLTSRKYVHVLHPYTPPPPPKPVKRKRVRRKPAKATKRKVKT